MQIDAKVDGRGWCLAAGSSGCGGSRGTGDVSDRHKAPLAGRSSRGRLNWTHTVPDYVCLSR